MLIFIASLQNHDWENNERFKQFTYILLHQKMYVLFYICNSVYYINLSTFRFLYHKLALKNTLILVLPMVELIHCCFSFTFSFYPPPQEFLIYFDRHICFFPVASILVLTPKHLVDHFTQRVSDKKHA